MQKRDARITFYRDSLSKSIPDRSSKVLILAAGPRDKMVFDDVGYTNVTFSNVDETYGAEKEFLPHAFMTQDAESLQLENNSFDFAVIHAALHHCHSPHRALLEMYRVARVGVFVLESRESTLMRLLERLAITETFEQRGVFFNGGGFGGVRNGSVPNFVYRWTEREVEKTISSFAPHIVNKISYYYGHDVPTELLYPGKSVRKAFLWTAYRAYQTFAAVFPRQQNLFAFYVYKGPLQPWVTEEEGKLRFNMNWGRAHFER
jgi:SAM-dependent methyltransferase